jgi:cell division protein FtsN
MSTAEVLAFADQVSGQAQPIGPETAEPTAQADTPPDLGPVEPSVAGLVGQNPSEAAMGAMALKPPSRPAALATAASDLPQLVETAMPSVTEAAGSASTSATPIVLTAGLPSGTHLVQLGAFDSPEIAASEWARLQRTFDEFLGGREHVVQETQSSGRTLYRLRALGFPERADARILCAALTAEGADCIAVTVD